MLCGYHLSSEIFGYCQFLMFNCSESLKSRNWISILIELVFSSSSWLITECQPEPSGWNPVGALLSGASHYLCVDSQGRLSKMGSRIKDSYVIVSYQEWWSKLRFMYNELWKQYLQTWKPALCFLLEHVGSSSNASCSQPSICEKQTHKWR